MGDESPPLVGGLAYVGAMSDTLHLLRSAIELVTAEVDATEDWDAASPCEGWSALDVLAHVSGTMEKTRATTQSDGYGGGPSAAAGAAGSAEVIARWREAAAEALQAVEQADLDRVVTSPRGEMPLRDALSLPISDATVHAWDLAAAGGRGLELPGELRSHTEALVGSIPESALRASVFGPEVAAPADAGPTDRLMAFLGRRRA